MSTGSDFPAHLDVDLAGLSAAAAPWYAQLPVSDQRIQSVPDGRTLRFYQSTGLVDRPLRYEGRVARYGRRQLLQLLAIRALQARGQSLAQIQAALSGATDNDLIQTVSTALGDRPPVESARTQANPAAPATNPFLAAELAPGVVITIDSRVNTDPARVIALLRRAIQGEET